VAAGSARVDKGHEQIVAAGLPLRAQHRIQEAIETCRRDNGLDVSVLIGDLELTDADQFRAGAERLHAALGSRSAAAVLIVVAPGQRRTEIVTGPGVRRRVPDRVCALAVLSMTTAFTGGDLTGGVVDAIRQIAHAAGERDPLPPLDATPASSGSELAHH
jgi:uncharacterized membrane protein YgcG